jgi:hypothetical protein
MIPSAFKSKRAVNCTRVSSNTPDLTGMLFL